MSYTTVTDVVVMVPAINSITNITSEAIYTYITRVDNRINAKLAGAYSLPLPTGVYPILKDIATDLTIYEIVGKRNMTLVSRDKESAWPSRFKEAEKLLDQIAAGTMPLLNSSLQEVAQSAGGADPVWSNTQDYTPTMNEDEFSTMFQDQDKLDAIDDDRS